MGLLLKLPKEMCLACFGVDLNQYLSVAAIFVNVPVRMRNICCRIGLKDIFPFLWRYFRKIIVHVPS